MLLCRRFFLRLDLLAMVSNGAADGRSCDAVIACNVSGRPADDGTFHAPFGFYQ
jgi:hypothetical protein